MHTYAIEDFAVPDAHGQALRLMHCFRFWTWQLMVRRRGVVWSWYISPRRRTQFGPESGIPMFARERREGTLHSVISNPSCPIKDTSGMSYKSGTLNPQQSTSSPLTSTRRPMYISPNSFRNARSASLHASSPSLLTSRLPTLTSSSPSYPSSSALSSIIADNVATSEDVCRWKYAMMLVSMFTCDKSPRISRSASRSDVLLMSFSPAEAHHMKPEYARRDQVIGSTMESS
ncbi:hypothetical protein HBI69_069030 [Parastagonospora nodorum]|nr:hypothetical protein HBI69_069030 [Parastagonospora nodorum]